MIKFTGLILICAASALALLLPALGVVKFPVIPPTIPQAVPPGLMTGTNLAGNPPAGATPAGATPAGATPAGTDSGPILFGPPWTKQKLGLNVWLLLGPVLVIGLVMWTFAPNRGGLGR